MAKLTLVANITAKADKIDLVKAELEKLIDITRAEEGCLQYDLHQDNENPAHFMFYENWESRELWQAHMSAQHLPSCKEALNRLPRSTYTCCTPCPESRSSRSPGCSDEWVTLSGMVEGNDIGFRLSTMTGIIP